MGHRRRLALLPAPDRYLYRLLPGPEPDPGCRIALPVGASFESIAAGRQGGLAACGRLRMAKAEVGAKVQRRWPSPEWLFAIMALIGGIVLVALIPPVGGGNERYN